MASLKKMLHSKVPLIGQHSIQKLSCAIYIKQMILKETSLSREIEKDVTPVCHKHTRSFLFKFSIFGESMVRFPSSYSSSYCQGHQEILFFVRKKRNVMKKILFIWSRDEYWWGWKKNKELSNKKKFWHFCLPHVTLFSLLI